MSSSLLVSSIGEDAYDDYIERLMDVYRLSSKDSSIIGNISIKGEKSKATLSIVDSKSGYSNDFTDVVFKNNENFYERFIKEIVRRMNSECHVLVNDLVQGEDDKTVTYRMVTENNDLFTIEGLDKARAKQIMASYKKEDCEPKLLLKSGNLGEGNYLIFITMIVIIILTLILVYIMMK